MTAAGEGGRYGWRRLTVEGLVIVASILLAFAVDAAWDSHVENERLSSSLVQLQAQLAANQEEISRAIEVSQSYLDRLTSFTETTPEELLELPVEALIPFAEAFWGSGIYDQDGGVVEQFVASGLLSLVSDPELRVSLMTWSTLPDELAEDYAPIPGTDELLRSLMTDHGVFSALAGSPGTSGLDVALADMRRDRRASELVFQKVFALEGYMSELEEYRAGLFERLSEQLGPR